jgi:hypothetical protein
MRYLDSSDQQIAELDVDERRFEFGGLNDAGAAAVVILRDGHGREVLRLSAQSGNLIVGGLNPEREQDGDLILNDKIGREAIRLSASGANITVGGGNGLADGDITLKDKSGDIVIQMNADGASIEIGGENNDDVDGELTVKDHEGKPVITLDGEARAVTAGGNGTPGRLMAKNGDDRVTAGLDGEQNALMLRSPNGTVFKVTVTNNGDLETTRV